MKTVKNENEVRRVPDEQAQKLVASGKWWYCPKSVYKQSRRPTLNAVDPATPRGERLSNDEWQRRMNEQMFNTPGN